MASGEAAGPGDMPSARPGEIPRLPRHGDRLFAP